MGLFRKLGNFLGLSKDGVELRDGEQNDAASASVSASPAAVQHLPRKGFSVPVQLPVDRPPPPGPVLVPCVSGDGGVQGLRWFGQRLRIDEDGDIADEFLDEVLPEKCSTVGVKSSTLEEHQNPYRKLEVKYSTKPATVRNQVRSRGGKILVSVGSEGRLEWV